MSVSLSKNHDGTGFIKIAANGDTLEMSVFKDKSVLVSVNRGQAIVLNSSQLRGWLEALGEVLV